MSDDAKKRCDSVWNGGPACLETGDDKSVWCGHCIATFTTTPAPAEAPPIDTP